MRTNLVFTLCFLLAWTISGCGSKDYIHQPAIITLATTTSTDNSGLLDVLLPVFKQETGITVRVIAVGTGRALRHGEEGDVDIVLVHAPAAEKAFVEAGYGVERIPVMHNDFVILGPVDAPLFSSSATAADALKAIAEAENTFVSRGDDSGTHKKEKALWDQAGIIPAGEWYREAGQGMGAVLTMTSELQGYTLADRGTWLAMQDKLDLQLSFGGDPALFNPYAVIMVNPERHPHVQTEPAQAFIDFLISEKGQKLIDDFTVNGKQLFVPDVHTGQK